MLTQITDRIPPLNILIPVLLIIWAGACTVLHGPAILAYVAIQAATSGIFALSMYKISKRHTHGSAKSGGETAVNANSSSAKSNDQPVTV